MQGAGTLKLDCDRFHMGGWSWNAGKLSLTAQADGTRTTFEMGELRRPSDAQSCFSKGFQGRRESSTYLTDTHKATRRAWCSVPERLAQPLYPK